MINPVYGGSTFKDANKGLWTWAGNYSDSKGMNHTKRISAKTKKGLNKKVADFFAKQNDERNQEQDITLKKWLEQWLEVIVQPSVKHKTYATYKQRLSYASNIIGGRRLKTINSFELQSFFNSLEKPGSISAKGLAASNINQIRRYLKIALDAAIEHGYLIRNPVKGTKPLKGYQKEIIVIDEEQVNTLLNIAKSGTYITYGVKNPRCIYYNQGTEYLNHCCYNFVNLALASGMRFGELCGLKWECIDFANCMISVKEQLLTSNDRLQYFDTPKSRTSRRNISIDDNTISELKEFKEYQEEYAKTLGDKFCNEKDLVFTNGFGKPMDRSNFVAYRFKKMLGAANLPKGFTVHCLRHTHATLLLKNKVDLKAVSERLGHSSPDITLKIYYHLLGSMEKEAPTAWQKIISVAKDEERK